MEKIFTPQKIILIGILALAFVLRVYGINWDSGHHLHPDERMLIMVANDISIPDNLDPDFFNYGSLPVYLVRIVGQAFDQANYDGMLILGRMLSVIFDMFTLLVIVKLVRLLFKKESAALFAGFIYAVAVFPIQNSHFFVVDVYLTFFITLSLYLLLSYITKPQVEKLVGIGIAAAGAITSKFTGVLLLPMIGLFLIVASFSARRATSLKPFGLRLLRDILIFVLSYVAFSFIFMPYGFLHYEQYVSEISLQTKMSSDPFVFPYTLQYVGTTAYLYYLRNIFLWGLGPIISVLSIVGLVLIVVDSFKKPKHSALTRLKVFAFRIPASSYIVRNLVLILFLAFYLWYFFVLGKSAVKFMRYMLPLYPFFAILAGFCLGRLYNLNIVKSKLAKGIVIGALLIASSIWSVMFVGIYDQDNTRVQATNWLYNQVPPGSTLAVEHWDDQLPLRIPGYDNEQYFYESLELYNPDTDSKWNIINQQIERSDYIVLASNRLYTPLPKLINCDKLPSHRCYPRTKKYYEDLFSGKLGYEKVAEFSSYPRLSVFGLEIQIPDDTADESFTVYDHPKVMIFKNVKS